MEACSSAHHWARTLGELGHTVKPMPPTYVKPYVKRGKNDAADAEAICEAVTRPTRRFVPIKSMDQQAVLMLHRTRALLMRQRTMTVNAVRGHLAEFGLIAAQGAKSLFDLIRKVFTEGLNPCRAWHGSLSRRSSHRSSSFRYESKRSTRSCWLGIDRTLPADD